MKIITTTGYGNSGSSAITDFIKEFSNISYLPHTFECTFIHDVNGLYDLSQAVKEGHRLKVDAAAHNFLNLCKQLHENEYKYYFKGLFYQYSEEFIYNFFECNWHGWWFLSPKFTEINEKTENLFEYAKLKFQKQNKRKYELYETDSWRPSYQPFADQFYSNDYNRFILLAKNYLKKLFNLISNNNDTILIDQLLPPTNTENYLMFFDDIKVIITDRDPRDYYLLNNLFWGSRYIPTENLLIYIKWFKETRNILITQTDKILKIKLEELIYNYNDTKEVLTTFLELDKKNHLNKFKYFDPNKSIKNTNIFSKYTNYTDDLELISKELKKYLFNNYPEIKIKKQNYQTPIFEQIKQLDNIILKNKLTLFQKIEFLLLNTLKHHEKIKINFNKFKKNKKIKNFLSLVIFITFYPFFIFCNFFKSLIKIIIL